MTHNSFFVFISELVKGLKYEAGFNRFKLYISENS